MPFVLVEPGQVDLAPAQRDLAYAVGDALRVFPVDLPEWVDGPELVVRLVGEVVLVRGSGHVALRRVPVAESAREGLDHRRRRSLAWGEREQLEHDGPVLGGGARRGAFSSSGRTPDRQSTQSTTSWNRDASANLRTAFAAGDRLRTASSLSLQPR